MTFPIHDPVGLAAALSKAVERRCWLEWNGEQLESDTRSKAAELQKVAEQIDISYSTLHRLTHGTVSVVSWRTAFRLEQELSGQEWEEVRRFLLHPKVRRAQREYAAYIEREIGRLRERRSRKHDVSFSPEVGRLVKRFEEHARRRGAPATRLELAKLRAVDAYVGWAPLRGPLGRSEDLVRVVKLTLKREEILLQHEIELVHRFDTESHPGDCAGCRPRS